jgi:hypothetical protein
MDINPALIGKAGEMLVAAELMRRGVEVALPASDVGVDLLAYRLAPKETVARMLVPIQVKARSETGYTFSVNGFRAFRGWSLSMCYPNHARVLHLRQLAASRGCSRAGAFEFPIVAGQGGL